MCFTHLWPQINDVDLTDARHDQAVNLLVGPDKEIRLVVYREQVVDAEEAQKHPPPGEKVENVKQPRIIWNKTVATTVPTETITFSSAAPLHYEDITVDVSHNTHAPPPPLRISPTAGGAAPAPVSPVRQQPGSPTSPSSPVPPPLPAVPAPSLSPSPYTQAIPASYRDTHPPQSNNSPPAQTMHKVNSPSLSPRTLSSDWNSPPAAIQPPKFQYPGIKRPSSSRTSATEQTVADPRRVSGTTPVITAVETSVSNSTVNTSAPRNISDNVSTNSTNNKFGDREFQNSVSLDRQTISVPSKSAPPPEPVVGNHVDRGSVNNNEEKYPLEDCVIVKAGGPLGLSIVGGSDHSSSPFGEDQPGIFVSKVSGYSCSRQSECN